MPKLYLYFETISKCVQIILKWQNKNMMTFQYLVGRSLDISVIYQNKFQYQKPFKALQKILKIIKKNL
jgi:hypothetical protein